MINVLLACLTLLYLMIGCAEKGAKGEKGEEGDVVYSPSMGIKLLAKCENNWQDWYRQVYMVRENSEGTRVASVCYTDKEKCEPQDFTSQEYQSNSSGWGEAKVSNNVVSAFLVGGAKYARFEIIPLDRQATVECKGE